MLKVDAFTQAVNAVGALQGSPLALVVLVALAALVVVGLALFVVLTALKPRRK